MRVSLSSRLVTGFIPYALIGLSACTPFWQSAPSLPSPASVGIPTLTRIDTMGSWMYPFGALPERVRLGGTHLRLPGATLNDRGSVRAAVFPFSAGARHPVWSDSLIAFRVLGSAQPGDRRGTAGMLAEASQGLFRLDASVFPTLIDPSVRPEELATAVLDPHFLTDLAERVVSHWASHANLAAFDNNGPDGQPMSGDDDDEIDFALLVIETDSTPALVHLSTDLDVPAGRDGRLRLKVKTVHVLALPRTGTLADNNLGPVALLLGAMGLEPEEMFFPAGTAHPISTLARLRLGWIAGRWAGHSGTFEVPDGQAVAVPIVDVPDDRGLWLIERVGENAYLTRVARKANGHFATVDARQVRPMDPSQLIPLTRTAGDHGPRMRIHWPAPDLPLELNVALSPKAVHDDDEQRVRDDARDQAIRERIAAEQARRDSLEAATRAMEAARAAAAAQTKRNAERQAASERKARATARRRAAQQAAARRRAQARRDSIARAQHDSVARAHAREHGAAPTPGPTTARQSAPTPQAQQPHLTPPTQAHPAPATSMSAGMAPARTPRSLHQADSGADGTAAPHAGPPSVHPSDRSLEAGRPAPAPSPARPRL